MLFIRGGKVSRTSAFTKDHTLGMCHPKEGVGKKNEEVGGDIG